jgi:predicted secreted protein
MSALSLRVAAFVLASAASWAFAQVPAGATSQGGPQNVVQLSAQAHQEVPQDLLTLTLNTTREAPDAATAQAQLKLALDGALQEARKAAQPGQMDVRTGHFSLYPRHGRDGRITGWQGSVELILEGRDFGRISTTAGKVQGMTVSGVGFSLSREQRAKVESEIQSLAIERFKARAADVAKAFGFGGYGLREVNIQSHDSMPGPRPRVMAMEARAAAADMAVPVEAGKATVTVSVSGSVQLR